MEAGDVSASAGKKRYATTNAAASTSSSDIGLSLKTPAPSRFGKPPITTQRTIRKGEMMYSANGSPVGQYEPGEMMITAKKRKGGQPGKTPFPISIGIAGGNGETIDITDANQRRNMHGDQKNQALLQLMAMQRQM